MRYLANPAIVEAFKIVVIHWSDAFNRDVNVILDSGQTVTVTRESIARINLKVGDYWVVESDGFAYLIPAEVFEKKYSPLECQP